MENKEAKTDGWPTEFKVFDPMGTLRKLGHFLFDHFRYEGLSSHNRGGGPMLDRELEAQGTFAWPEESDGFDGSTET